MRVTVGISFYNSERTLADAIRSVFAQTLDDWELVLVDDGSTDGSLAIAQSVDDPRVRVVSDGENRRIPHRLNQIASLAQGEYTAKMDSDDLMHPERLERQLEFLDANPGVDLLGSAIYIIDAGGNIKGLRHTDPLNSSPPSVVKHGAIQQPTAMARTDWWRANRYDPKYDLAEDHELWCRASLNSGIARLAEPLLYYRETHKAPWPYLRTYRVHCFSKARAIAAHGPRANGFPETACMMAAIFGKLGVYYAATALGMQGKVIGRRQLCPIDEHTLRVGLDGMDRIMSTVVPGLSAPRVIRR